MAPERPDLVSQFVTSFSRAIALEMDAMRARLGPFEVPLANGRLLRGEEAAETFDLRYTLGGPIDKLLVGMECSLVAGQTEQLVTVTDLEAREVSVRAARKIPLDVPAHLVIYPWFLYERLRQLLQSIDQGRFYPDTAFRLFARLPASVRPCPLRLDHQGLDPSQLRAVELCAGAEIAFVWGPPGTGKTNTLGHLVAELLAQRRRVLVTSTTNAALDQALERLARRPETRSVIDAGQAVRIGRTEADTHGAALSEVIARLGEFEQQALREAQRRELAARTALGASSAALERLTDPGAAQQALFSGMAPSAVVWDALGTRLAGRWRQLPVNGQIARVRRRRDRLARLVAQCRLRTERLSGVVGSVGARVVSQARLVLATLTNAYFSPLLAEERFDVLVVDEAAMAILPSLFYASCLARTAAVMVGDPQQLPAIVQSDDPYVRRAMGRNIFEVGAAGEDRRALVAMLRTQYRMHPAIGDLVSVLFYGGQLHHGAPALEVEAIAAAPPYPGAALALVDMGGEGAAQVDSGGSRFHQKSAAASARIARQAIAAGARSIAVITPYVAQARTIRELLGRDARGVVECSTVHRFQGRERDLVILDAVDSEPLRPGVLLTEGAGADNLVNVSLSRARGKAIVVADRSYFLRSAPRSPIARAITFIAEHGIVVAAPRDDA